MIYLYTCDHCNVEKEVYKPVSECRSVELCIVCNKEMRRIYTPALLNCSGHHADFKTDEKTGAEMVCIGNEVDAFKKKVRKSREEKQKYDLPREAADRLVKAIS